MEMPKLARGHDGKYIGTYRGHDLVVWKEAGTASGYSHTAWIARSGGLEVRENGRHATRDGVVLRLCQEVDMAAVQIPEIDQLLVRWSEEIKAIAPQLRHRDHQAMRLLISLRRTLAWLDNIARAQAVRFEQDIAQLRARAGKPRIPDWLDGPSP
jgi:hypothetical protein